jgi:hypothetical protein
MCGCAGFDGSNSNGQAVKQQPSMIVGNSTALSINDKNTTKLIAGLAVGLLFFLAYKKNYS